MAAKKVHKEKKTFFSKIVDRTVTCPVCRVRIHAPLAGGIGPTNQIPIHGIEDMCEGSFMPPLHVHIIRENQE